MNYGNGGVVVGTEHVDASAVLTNSFAMFKEFSSGGGSGRELFAKFPANFDRFLNGTTKKSLVGNEKNKCLR